MLKRQRTFLILTLIFLAILAIGIRQTGISASAAPALEATVRAADAEHGRDRKPRITIPGNPIPLPAEGWPNPPDIDPSPDAALDLPLAETQGQGRIAFAGAGGGVWAMDPDGSDAQWIGPGVWESWDPIWSSDGSQVVFGIDSSAFVVNHDGTGLIQMAPGLHEPFAFDWSAGGDRILFTAGTYDTYIMNPDGTGLASIAAGIGAHSLGSGLSPDGQWAAIPAQKANGRWGIYKHNLTTNQGEWLPGEFYCTIRSNLCPNTFFTYYADWSPDGGRIAFIGVRTEEYLCGFLQWCGRAIPALYSIAAHGGAGPAWLGDISTTQNPRGYAAFGDLDWDAAG